MARKIIWTETAWSDLEGIADHIAEDSVYYAAAFVREIRDASRTLERLAQRGRVVPEFGDLTIRELLIENYRLIYKTEKTAVNILGLIHGARDLKSLWKRKQTKK
jgi:plasmid stabilization system protein ParE